MYQYDKKHIEINGNIYDFDFDIRTVIQYKERFIGFIYSISGVKKSSPL